jgi:hypothetical protein
VLMWYARHVIAFLGNPLGASKNRDRASENLDQSVLKHPVTHDAC